MERPQNYPDSSNSAIHDAQAFTVGASSVIHAPGHYPDGLTVVARCGVYGYTTERDGYRLAEWSASRVTCRRCTA